MPPFDVRLPEANEADDEIVTVVQPDLLVTCDKSKLDDKGMRGAPDWVIEITSPSSGKRDKLTKLELYEKHGVREYWIVEPFEQVVTIWRMQDGRYGRPEILSDEHKARPALFPELEIDLGQVFAQK